MKIDDWLHKSLDIQAPWQISHLIADPATRRVDLWVTLQPQRSGWFFGSRQQTPTPGLPIWRHLNLGLYSCHIHANPRETGWHNQLPWLGEEGQPFSRALGQQIAGHFKAGLGIPAICPLLDIPPADLWKFKHHLDQGLTALGPAAQPSAANVPDADHPIWLALLDGSRQLDIRVLSLKLLLTKLRDQVQRINDSQVRVLKAHELQRYFVRHAHLLTHELAQLDHA